MDDLIRDIGKTILVYLAVETLADPIEKNVTRSYLNPTPIYGIVTDLTATKAQWAMPGIVTDKAKEIIVDKQYKSLLEQSGKLQILGETDNYDGWRINSKMQIREEGDYIRVYIYIKKDS